MDGVIYFPWDPARDAKPFPPKHDHTNQMNPSHKPVPQSTLRPLYFSTVHEFLPERPKWCLHSTPAWHTSRNRTPRPCSSTPVVRPTDHRRCMFEAPEEYCKCGVMYPLGSDERYNKYDIQK